MAQFPSEDHAAVSAAATAAVLASATEAEDGNAPPWRLDNEYTSEVLFDVISSRSALSGTGKDGQRFAHLQCIIHTDIGREEFGRGMTAFWRRLVDKPDAFLPEFGISSCSRVSPSWEKSIDRFAWAWHGGGSPPQELRDSGGRD